jgi:hypothetical protein
LRYSCSMQKHRTNLFFILTMFLASWPAAGIVVDGSPADWQSIFRMRTGYSDLPIEFSALSIDAEQLCGLFVHRTAAVPTIQIEIDFERGQSFDRTISLDSSEVQKSQSGKNTEFCIKNSRWSALGILLNKTKRNWIRIRPLSPAGKVIGPAIAAGVYGVFPKDLFTQVFQPKWGSMPKIPQITFPLALRGYLAQGSFGEWTHGETWGVDLTVADDRLEYFEKDALIGVNESYFAWGQPLLSPVAGKILRLEIGAKDLPPRNVQKNSAMNQIFIEASVDSAIWMAHFQKDSLAPLLIGSRISEGQTMGKIGNSGPSGWPHLHIGAWKMPKANQTMPFVFKNIRTFLNPDPLDPWSVLHGEWEPQEGFFLEKGP